MWQRPLRRAQVDAQAMDVLEVDAPIVPVPAAVPAAPADANDTTSLECPVDGQLAFPAERSSSKFYMFTQVSELVQRPGRKTPEEVGREGLYNAIGRAYGRVFPEGHACRTGPCYGKVAQEKHQASTDARMQRVHNHAICAFPADHRWKAIERDLREVEGIKVGLVFVS